MRYIYDIQTGESRMEEIDKAELDAMEQQAAQDRLTSESASSARASAIAKLQAIGLTEEEIVALVGGV
jgi:hypothetical protein